MKTPVPYDEMPENIKKVWDVFSSQYSGAYENHGWNKINPECFTDGKTITVRIESVEIGIVFDMGGTFYGMYNWKQ